MMLNTNEDEHADCSQKAKVSFSSDMNTNEYEGGNEVIAEQGLQEQGRTSLSSDRNTREKDPSQVTYKYPSRMKLSAS